MKNKTLISIYPFETLKKYVKGEMTSIEMRQLELDSLKDPFLSDALEGIMLADLNKATKDVAFIKANLNNKLRKVKIIHVQNSSLQWLKVAAIFILLIGASWLSYYLVKDNNPNMAVTKFEEEKKELPAVAQQEKVRNSLLTQKNKIQNNFSKERPVKEPKDDLSTIHKIPSEDRKIEPEEQKILQLDKRRDEGFVTIVPKESAKAASPLIEKSEDQRALREAVPTDKDKNFSLKKGKSKNDNNAPIPSQSTIDLLDKTAEEARGYIATPRQRNSSLSSNLTIEIKIDSIVSELPVIGTTAFAGYVEQYLETDNQLTQKGYAIFKFKVTKKGKPQHVMPTETDNKDLCKHLQAAIYNGPDWTRQKSKSVSLTIQVK